MKIWPLNPKVPKKTAPEKAGLENTDLKKTHVPQKGEPCTFRENRGDRYHCRIDLYVPENTETVSLKEELAQKPV